MCTLRITHAHIAVGYIAEHILVAEKALGHALPEGAVVHHVNGIKDDNRPSNLVICQDRAYHLLLHRRIKVLQAGGNPNTDRICCSCKAAKPKTEFSQSRYSPLRANRGLVCSECNRTHFTYSESADRVLGEVCHH